MPAQAAPYASPAVRAFANELKAWREDAGHNKAELSRLLGYTPQYVGQVEECKNRPSRKFSEDCDTFFKTNGVFFRLWKNVNDTRHMAILPPGFPEYVERESRAISIRNFSPNLVNGLLQNEEYAQTVLGANQQPDLVEQLVRDRLGRQEIFSHASAPRAWFTIDERVLRCVVGGASVMHGQLAHILEMSDRPNIMVNVIPLCVGFHDGLGGSFTILGFEDGTSAAYTESAGEGMLIEQPPRVANHVVRYDLLRGYALDVSESRAMIKEAMESYERQAADQLA